MPLDSFDDRAIALRRRAGTCDPAVEVVVALLEQPLEVGERLGAEMRQLGVGEAAEDQVHLAGAAPPAPDPDAPEPSVVLKSGLRHGPAPSRPISLGRRLQPGFRTGPATGALLAEAPPPGPVGSAEAGSDRA
jgi:hypothetical protein